MEQPAFESEGTIDVGVSLREAVGRQRLVAIVVGVLLSALDQTVVGTAMPRMIADSSSSAR